MAAMEAAFVDQANAVVAQIEGGGAMIVTSEEAVRLWLKDRPLGQKRSVEQGRLRLVPLLLFFC